jgi:hypothetical protein
VQDGSLIKTELCPFSPTSHRAGACRYTYCRPPTHVATMCTNKYVYKPSNIVLLNKYKVRENLLRLVQNMTMFSEVWWPERVTVLKSCARCHDLSCVIQKKNEGAYLAMQHMHMQYGRSFSKNEQRCKLMST